MRLVNIVYAIIYHIVQESGISSEHTWIDTNASGDFCYVGETDCSVGVAMPTTMYNHVTTQGLMPCC